MSVALLGWLLIPTYGWRSLCICTALPSILIIPLYLMYFPRSPKWLLNHGDEEACRKVLQSIAKHSRKKIVINKPLSLPKVSLPLNKHYQHVSASSEYTRFSFHFNERTNPPTRKYLHGTCPKCVLCRHSTRHATRPTSSSSVC